MRSLKLLAGYVAIVAVVAGCQQMVSAEAPFWPRFHGPNQDNISTDTGLLGEWPKDGPPLAWTAKGLGEGFASVVLAGGRIYTAGNIKDKMTITALDMQGQILWQVDNGEAYTKSYPGSRGTPTLDGNRLYHESPSGQVICLNAQTGEQIWTVNILDEFKGREIIWALAESVLIDGNRVICCPGGPETAVVALDKMTGRTVWKSPSADGELAGYASPALAVCDGLRIILTMTNESLIGVNADGGELLFRFGHPTKYEVNALMPVYRDGHIFISSGYGTTGSKLLKLNVRGRKASVEEVWSSKDLDNHHEGVVVLDGYIYGSGHMSGRGRWVCLDWRTGKTMWADKGIGKGAVTFADGMLYGINEDRTVGLIKPSPAKYECTSEFDIPRGGRGKTWAHPVVCGGRLYLRHGEFLYVYDVRAK